MNSDMEMAENQNVQLEKLDDRQISSKSGRVLSFIGIRNEILRLPFFLEYHRNLGVDQFFVMDNGSDDGTREYVLEQPDCHCFHTEGSHFANNVKPPNWTNTLLNVFGEGQWCVAMDADELLVYPDCESVNLAGFCKYLDRSGTGAFEASMIDMYCDGPIADAHYESGQKFMDAAPYFDPEPGTVKQNFGGYPQYQMFGGVRERVFWKGRFKQTQPPCLTKVPLVKWQRGMHYFVAQHTISPVGFSELKGALLHFKFHTGFEDKTELSLSENDDVQEKGLQERQAYVEVLRQNPKLQLKNNQSLRYQNSQQLVDLGWMKSSPEYVSYVGERIQ